MYVKLRKISGITATLPFTEFDFMQKCRESFAVSELGRIYAQLPLKELAEKIRSHLPKTHPQGSFGNQKQHYGVGRIAARNSRSETLLLFFGIHMANAAILASRQLATEEKEKKRKNSGHEKSCCFNTSE